MRGSGPFALGLARCWLFLACLICGYLSPADAAQAGAAPQDAPATTTPPPAVGPAPLADPRNVTDQAPGSTAVQITLGDGFLNQRLPFDIPFYVAGSVADAAATRVDLTVYQLRRSAGASDFVAQLQTTYDCVAANNVQPFLRSRSGVSTGRTFNLLVDPLDPQRYYVFCFVTSGAVPLSEIATPIRNIFADAVTTLVPQEPTDVSLELGRAVHQRLRDEITRIGARRAVPAVIPDGNIFKDERQVARGTPFTALVIELINAYRAASDTGPAYTQYNNFRNTLRNDVNTAAAGAASDLLTPALVATLSLNAELPSPRLAFTSTTPVALNAPPFNVDAAAAALTAVATTASGQKRDDVAKVLSDLAARVRTLGLLSGAYARNYELLSTAAGRAIEHVVLESRVVSVNLGSTVLSAELSRNAYVSLDAGIAYPWRLENMVFYAGTNIYFRPINKDAPLRDKGTFFHRFALTIGVTTTVKDDSRRALDLRPTENNTETSNSLLIGGGLRVTSSIRLGAGALVFKESSSNPLVEQTSVRTTPYVSLAADVNVAEVLKSFFP